MELGGGGGLNTDSRLEEGTEEGGWPSWEVGDRRVWLIRVCLIGCV